MDSALSAQLQASQFPASPAVPATPAARANLAKIERAAQDFEALFLSEMLKPMFDGLSTDGPFGGGQAEETYRGLLVEEYGKSVAKAGGIGLADQIAREMLKMQETQQ
ncbi:MAG: rod-binding protein [Tistlia sp.]|uniref:rod-binding protein n=1 Tax=Tistlia sp. TaxID=3057121 RepID=UPI0034A470C4